MDNLHKRIDDPSELQARTAAAKKKDDHDEEEVAFSSGLKACGMLLKLRKEVRKNELVAKKVSLFSIW